MFRMDERQGVRVVRSCQSHGTLRGMASTGRRLHLGWMVGLILCGVALSGSVMGQELPEMAAEVTPASQAAPVADTAAVPDDIPAMPSIVDEMLAKPWSPAPDAANTDRRLVFDTLRDQWWPILSEMQQLQKEYRQPTTAVDRQDVIRQRFAELSEQAKKVMPDLARAALEAYCQDRKKSDDLFPLIASYILDGVQNGRLEESLRYCQRLIDTDENNPMPAALAAVIAARLGDAAKAKEYLVVTEEKSVAFNAEQKIAAESAADGTNSDGTEAANTVDSQGFVPSDFLYNYLQMACSNDDYEVAYELAKLLISVDYQGEWFPAFAGYAAYCVNDFDMAEEQLKKAQENKWLAPRGGDDVIARARQALSSQNPDGSKRTLADSRKEWEAEAAIRASQQAAGEADPEKLLPRVKLYTSKGEVVVELFEEEAPIAVANFLTLVENGFYTEVPFHRVLPGFMAQGGDPTGTGGGGPGYVIRSEFTRPDARKHFRGTLSMARTNQPDTEGSQFFLCFVPAKFLDGNYTAFGRVVEGMDVLAKIQKMDPDRPEPDVLPDEIRKAEVLRKRNHPYTFEKLNDR